MLSDALHFVITMCLKMKEKTKIPSTLVNLINGDFGVVLELSLLAFNIKEVIGGVGVFSFFSKEI